MRVLDNRGMAPPEPMVRVLEAVENLVAGEVLTVMNDRPPLFLYPILVKRGFAWETIEDPAGHVLLLIRKVEQTVTPS